MIKILVIFIGIFSSPKTQMREATICAISEIRVQKNSEPNYYALGSEEFFNLEILSQKIEIEDLDRELLEAAIFFASNEARTSENEKPLHFNKHLKKAARFHVDYLEDKKIVDHLNRHNRKYREPKDRIQKFGGNFRSTSENLALIATLNLAEGGQYFENSKGEKVNRDNEPLEALTYSELARKVVDGWMNSAGHRKNLLGNYTHLGCGVSKISFDKDGIPEIYFAQNFGNQ